MEMLGFDLNQTTYDSNQVAHILFIECFDLDQIEVQFKSDCQWLNHIKFNNLDSSHRFCDSNHISSFF